MSNGARIAILVGIIIAIAVGATVVALTAQQGSSNATLGSENNTTTEPRQIEVNLNENLTVKAK